MSANNLLKTELYSVDDNQDIVVTKIDSLNLFINTNGNDSILYYKTKKISEFYIPLSDSASQFKIILQLNQFSDTILIDYKPYSVFRSTECGVINRYEIQNIQNTQNKIWGIFLNNSQVDETEATNIFLVFYPN